MLQRSPLFLPIFALCVTGCAGLNQGSTSLAISGTVKSYPFLDPLSGRPIQAIELPAGQTVTTTSDSHGNYSFTLPVASGGSPWLLLTQTPGDHILSTPIWPPRQPTKAGSGSHLTVDLTPGTSVLTSVLIEDAGAGPKTGFFSLTDAQKSSLEQSLAQWNQTRWTNSANQIDQALQDQGNLSALSPEGVEQLAESLHSSYQRAEVQVLNMDHRLLHGSVKGDDLLNGLVQAVPAALSEEKGLLTAFDTAVSLADLPKVAEDSLGPDSLSDGDLEIRIGLDKLNLAPGGSSLPDLVSSIRYDIEGSALPTPVQGEIGRAYLDVDPTTQAMALSVPKLAAGPISVSVTLAGSQGGALAAATGQTTISAGRSTELDLEPVLVVSQLQVNLGQLPTPVATL